MKTAIAHKTTSVPLCIQTHTRPASQYLFLYKFHAYLCAFVVRMCVCVRLLWATHIRLRTVLKTCPVCARREQLK